ncbi:hypothetical protein SAMN05421544_11231 [Riemerella columbipharyngis]|uniref:Uncharacterized protein n=1 Tax=Riemerella columbipharyngis TaxID=1071918 RepID=A0A1G7DRW3_9FLAO|nr:hypothetical protein SAMN05421544_11231 [Riemerella columbipharyngis]
MLKRIPKKSKKIGILFVCHSVFCFLDGQKNMYICAFQKMKDIDLSENN